MFNPINAEQEQQLRALIHEHELGAAEDLILSWAQCAIVLEMAPVGQGNAGRSRLGGLPDVPAGWQWPEGLTFLGQIDLKAMANYDQNKVLPASGILLFFINDYGWDKLGLPGRIQYIIDAPDGTSELLPARAPHDYLPMSLCAGGDGREVYNARDIVARSIISLPAVYTRQWETLEEVDSPEVDMTDAYSNLLGALNSRRHHQLLGHHAFMDGNADEEAWSATNGVPIQLIGKEVSPEEREKTLQRLEESANHYEMKLPEETDPLLRESAERMVRYYQDEREAYLRYLEQKDQTDAQLSEWVLLLQMDSDDDLGTMFNDAGFAYFMTRRSDLATARFDRVYASLWSS